METWILFVIIVGHGFQEWGPFKSLNDCQATADFIKTYNEEVAGVKTNVRCLRRTP